MRIAAVVLCLALSAAARSRADGLVFPKDSGVLNVKAFGATGDGRTDDTAALQALLDAHPNAGRILYFPNGTYRITDTLRWPHGAVGGAEEKNTILQGQSREGVVLRLPDAAPGFSDPKAPKALIWTGRAPAQRFRNAVRDLTIDTGKGNPGAIGMQFMANNQGCVRAVTIRSGDRKSHIGLDLAYTDENGPCLIKDVKVVGFDYGIRAAHAVDSLVFEDITLQDQNRFGLVNEGQCLSIRGLASRNAVTAVINAGPIGVLVLIDADLRGGRGAIARPAVLNEGFLHARNVASVGYAETIRNAANARRPGSGRAVAEFASHPAPALDGEPVAPDGPRLAAKPTPEVPWDGPKDWASPTHFGAKPDDDQDDSDAIQRAIDSGKTTVYFPNGTYKVGKTVVIRGPVRRLIGCEAGVVPEDLKGEPAFRLDPKGAPVVVFERLWGGYSTTTMLENATPRTLVVKDCCNVNGRFTGPGEVFLEDVCSNPFTGWEIVGKTVWARQLNVENQGRHVLNDGGKLWVLGFKTERGGTLVDTRGGGVTEILGGFCYTTTEPEGAPMFAVEGGSTLAVTLGESCFTGKPYETLVRLVRDGMTKDLKRGSAPERTGGSVLPGFGVGP